MQHTPELNISIEIQFLFVLPEQDSPGCRQHLWCSVEQASRAE